MFSKKSWSSDGVHACEEGYVVTMNILNPALPYFIAQSGISHQFHNPVREFTHAKLNDWWVPDHSGNTSTKGFTRYPVSTVTLWAVIGEREFKLCIWHQYYRIDRFYKNSIGPVWITAVQFSLASLPDWSCNVSLCRLHITLPKLKNLTYIANGLQACPINVNKYGFMGQSNFNNTLESLYCFI